MRVSSKAALSPFRDGEATGALIGLGTSLRRTRVPERRVRSSYTQWLTRDPFDGRNNPRKAHFENEACCGSTKRKTLSEGRLKQGFQVKLCGMAYCGNFPHGVQTSMMKGQFRRLYAAHTVFGAADRPHSTAKKATYT